MKIDITGRHVEITAALRAFTEEKLSRLAKLIDDPLEAHVVLAITKHRHVAEIQVKAPNLNLSGMEETDDLYASIGQVVDKLERQALRHKEKQTDHKHRGGTRGAGSEDGDTAPRPPGRIVRGQAHRLKPMTPEDAVLELEASREDVLVFRESHTDRINVVHRRPNGDFVLIDPEP